MEARVEQSSDGEEVCVVLTLSRTEAEALRTHRHLITHATRKVAEITIQHALIEAQG